MTLDAPVVRASQPFVESSDRKAVLAEHGYVFLRNLLAPEAVRRLRSQILDHVARAGWLAEGSEPDEAIPGPIAHTDKDMDDFLPVYRDIQATPLFHELGQSQALLDAVEEVLDEPAFCLPMKMARVKFPQRREEQLPTPPHQDYSYVQGSPDTLTAWVPLAETPAGNGRLAILAGSHRHGLQVYSDGWTAAERLGLNWHSSDYHVGDVLLFHCLTIHSAEDNPRDRLRITVDYRFQPVSDGVAPTSLNPHYEPAEWAELYRDWPSSELQYYWKKLPLRLLDRSEEFKEQAAEADKSRYAAPGGR